MAEIYQTGLPPQTFGSSCKQHAWEVRVVEGGNALWCTTCGAAGYFSGNLIVVMPVITPEQGANMPCPFPPETDL